MARMGSIEKQNMLVWGQQTAGKAASVGCKASELTFGRARVASDSGVTMYRLPCRETARMGLETGNWMKVIGQAKMWIWQPARDWAELEPPGMQASVHGGSVERRVWGRAKPWRAHVRHGKGKRVLLRSQEQWGPGRTRNSGLRKQRGHTMSSANRVFTMPGLLKWCLETQWRLLLLSSLWSVSFKFWLWKLFIRIE